MKICSLLLAFMLFSPMLQAADGGPVVLDSIDAREALVKFSKELKSAFEKYSGSLDKAKLYEAKKGNVDEVKAIDSALAGEALPISSFTSSSARNAKKSFDSSLSRASKTLVSSLESAQKKALTKGDTGEAERIQNIVNDIKQAQDAMGGRDDEKFTVYANKDWQDSGIKVQKDVTIKFECSGEWGPGIQNRVAKGRWENITGDADAYNVQVRVGDSRNFQGGTEWDITTPKEGELSFRMVPYNRNRRGEATGSMKVKMSFSRELTEDVLHATATKVAGINLGSEENKADGDKAATGDAKAENGKQEEQVKIIPLHADQSWQDTRITVKKGQEVNIQSQGKWSPGMKNKNRVKKGLPEEVYGTADAFKIEGKVGETNVGNGGVDWTFTAPEDGTLFLRMDRYDRFQERGFTPKGKLQVTIKAAGE